MTTLADHGIALRRPRLGWQGAACPACARSRRRPNDDALGVELFADGGARWKCLRCTWSGYIRSADRGGRRDGRRAVTAGAAAAAPPPNPTRVEYGPDHGAYWDRLLPITAGCPVGVYLGNRGCPPPPPGADLRHDPDRRHPHEGHWRGPAMVGRVTDAVTAATMSFHLTWVRPDGAGKAPLDRPRLLARGMAKRGGVIRLGDDADVGPGLCLAEGVETALTAALGFGPAVWACLDVGNLAAFPVLDGVEALTVVADHDPPDRNGRRAGQAAAEACARRWAEAGREVRVWTPTLEGQDLNDFVRGAA